MALNTGTVAASATPATDLFALLNTALVAAGWTEEVTRTYTASIMGTTANCRVYTSSTTTVAAGVYTGAIASFEIDDTNLRIRIRICEKFDSSLSGAAALNTKWAAPGNQESTAMTPTANYAPVNDNFVSHFQAAGTTQQVGWVEIAVTASGFNYWLGANASRFVVTVTAAANPSTCLAGIVNYAGDAGTAVGNASVFLMATVTTGSSTGSGSWTYSAANTAQVRVSREYNAAGSAAGWWTGIISGPMLPGTFGSIASYGGPGAGAHHFYSESFVTFPLWVHGGASVIQLRSNWFTIPEAIVLLRSQSVGALDRTLFPGLGDQVTVGATTYTSLSQVLVQSNSAIGQSCAVLIDGSSF